MGSIRPYTLYDYDGVVALYKSGALFGGQFDEARDSVEKLSEVTRRDPQSILVCEGAAGDILGTVSLIENGRVAWLFRFAVADVSTQGEIAQALYNAAREILCARGHAQILVYSDPNNEALNTRYQKLGMTKGNLFQCFWEEVG